MEYHDVHFKIPHESEFYQADSQFVVDAIEAIIQDTIKTGKNKIILNTNLKLGLPMENINKIAGPIVEAWAFEVFHNIKDSRDNVFYLVNVESRQRLDRADVFLQFQKNGSSVSADVDVKATAEDIKNSGKSPNITSFSRIRTAYIDDPDYMFIILSLKHKVFSKRNDQTGLIDGIFEIVKCNAYDLKYLSDHDISYNPSLGTGQIQVKDIHYVEHEYRTAWEFCQLLDRKYLSSSRRTFDNWYKEAKKKKWIKE
jgi:hypothetical protein